jgi:hypothetical protein
MSGIANFAQQTTNPHQQIIPNENSAMLQHGEKHSAHNTFQPAFMFFIRTVC